jgi:hypothetical protein
MMQTGPLTFLQKTLMVTRSLPHLSTKLELPGSKRAKKELLLRDMSFSASTTNAEAIQGLTRSHNNIAATLNIKEQIATQPQQRRCNFEYQGADCYSAYGVCNVQRAGR